MLHSVILTEHCVAGELLAQFVLRFRSGRMDCAGFSPVCEPIGALAAADAVMSPENRCLSYRRTSQSVTPDCGATGLTG